jgi:hypothetical protein
MTASYDDRIRAITDATRLLREMTTPPSSPGFTVTSPGVTVTYEPARSLDRFEVTELARFLLGMDDAADAEVGAA